MLAIRSAVWLILEAQFCQFLIMIILHTCKLTRGQEGDIVNNLSLYPFGLKKHRSAFNIKHRESDSKVRGAVCGALMLYGDRSARRCFKSNRERDFLRSTSLQLLSTPPPLSKIKLFRSRRFTYMTNFGEFCRKATSLQT